MIDKCTQYAIDVIDRKYVTGELVKLACERHMRDYELVDTGKRKDIRFNVDELNLVLDTSKCVRHFEGDFAGQQFEMNSWQHFLFGNMYAWQKYSEPLKQWVFKHKNNYIMVARKNGKTFCQAYSSIFDAAYILPTGAKVYCAATKEDQAKILWENCAAFIAASPELSPDFFTVRNRIYVDGSGRTSFIMPLGRDSKVASRGGGHEGLNPFTAKIDELHAHPDDGVYNVLNQAFGARTNRSITTITTAGENRFSFCKQLQDAKEKALREGTLPDDQFVLIYAIDPEDVDNWDCEDVWLKANPNLGIGKSLEEMRSLYADVKIRPSQKNVFLAKQLNWWVDSKQAWLSLDQWYTCRSKFTLKDLIGKRCSLGVDLARVRDLSAVAAYFPPQEGLPKAVLYVKYFIDNDTAYRRMKEDIAPYELWRDMGFVEFTPGSEIDFDHVENYICECCEIFDVEKIAFDPHLANSTMQNLKKKTGKPVIEMAQIRPNFSPICNNFEIQVNTNQIEYVENFCLDWNISNLAVITGGKGADSYIMPDKSDSLTKRIDGAVAGLIAKYADAYDAKAEKRQPKWLVGDKETPAQN